MTLLSNYFWALPVLLSMAAATWLVSLAIRNVSIVDSIWSLFFLAAAGTFAWQAETSSVRAILVLALVATWALRLSVYITARNWGEGEDYRYRQIRENNEPNFALKSLVIVFALQAGLAWIISAPLLVAVTQPAPLGAIDALALVLWIVGIVFEAGGDYQLSRFKSDPANSGKVLDSGLWAYTRHPNYFGDACIWWAFYLFALSAGGWWTFYGPALMTLLLLKVSGVAMLEKTISSRRPGYEEYVRNTNAFIPGPSARSRLDAGSVSS